MTIDVEDWFHVENLKAVIRFEQWSDCELRVRGNVERMLSILEQRQITCTFFVLGWVSKRCPQLVGQISAAGHEISCHSDRHELVYHLSPDAFAQDVAQ
jgi:peptidoglycan/xylan/chitin deacetylase (PgdA/CDA1 family)